MRASSPVGRIYDISANSVAGIWFIGLGVLLSALGMIAAVNLLFATIATTFLIGAFMFAGGVAQILHAAGLHRRISTVGWALAGLFYLVAGVAMLYDPMFGASLLTIFLAAALTVAGLIRIGFALSRHPRSWGWIFLSGLVTLAAGIVIGLGWPVNSAWVLGLFLAVDLMLQGFAAIATGILLRAPLAWNENGVKLSL